MNQPAPGPSHPALNAMLICDNTIREEGTGKVSLIGIFEAIFAAQFPVRHGLLCVYAKVTDAEGDYEIKLELVRLDDELTMGGGQARVTLADRMAPAEFVFQLPNLGFERPGRYEFRLFANGRWVGSKSFGVVLLQPPQATAGGGG